MNRSQCSWCVGRVYMYYRVIYVHAHVPLYSVREYIYTRADILLDSGSIYMYARVQERPLKARVLRESRGGCVAEKMSYVIIE